MTEPRAPQTHPTLLRAVEDEVRTQSSGFRRRSIAVRVEWPTPHMGQVYVRMPGMLTTIVVCLVLTPFTLGASLVIAGLAWALRAFVPPTVVTLTLDSDGTVVRTKQRAR